MKRIGQALKSFRLSILSKSTLTVIPLIATCTVTGYIAHQSLNGNKNQLAETSQIVELALKAETLSIAASNHLRGYLLDPRSKSELELKVEADKKHLEAIEAMMLLTEVPDVFRLIDKASEISDGKLLPLEKKILDLAKAGDLTNAQALYFKDYMPARGEYAANSQALVEASKKIAAAEADRLTGQMQRAFNEIVMSLVASVVIIIVLQALIALTLSRKLNRLAITLSGQADEFTTTSKQLLEASQSLTTRVTTQASAINKASQSVAEVSSMAEHNSENARLSEEFTSRSETVMAQGAATVNRMSEAIGDIRSANEELAKQMETGNKELAEIARVISEIDSKTKIINDIVFQTKLLSFNASIEAARAGEHGKGFAVVAEEVGNLAQMSGTAAKEIGEILAASVSRVDQIVENTRSRMERFISVGNEKVNVGTHVAKECLELFNEIMTTSAQVKQMASQIVVSSNEQTNGIRGITNEMNSINQINEENSRSAEDSAQAASHMSEKADELSNLVRDLRITVSGSLSVNRKSSRKPKMDSSDSNPSQALSPVKRDTSQKSA